jgi:nucleoside-diphosphate-sugar epimerase
MNRIIQDDLQSIVSAPLPWEDFAGASVLVTGGAGFLPAYMVETLLYLNREVLSKPCVITAFVRNWKRAEARFAGPSRGDVCIVEGDVAIQGWIPPFDYIIHAASQASPSVYLTDPVGTLLPNTVGTNLLLKASRNCRGFLFFSSGSAALPPDPLDPRACYSESKRMGETMCAAYHRQFNLPAKIVRISHTYGPGMRLDDGRVFADFTRDILRGGPIVLRSDGLAYRPFLYLAEATIAFFTVLLKGEPAKAYNVANPAAYMSIRELADRLAARFRLATDPPSLSTYVSAPPAIPPPDISDLNALGWNPHVTVEEGFSRTVESYKEADQ